MKRAEQTGFVWAVLLNHSCTQIAWVTANARSEFSAHSLEHAVKSALHESVCFSHDKETQIVYLGSKFTVSNAFLYI